MIDKIIQFFQDNPTSSEGKSPEGVCPNCWGKQEYDGTVRELIKDKQIDVNNKSGAHNFIQKFVVERIEGISLKKGTSGLECVQCAKMEGF